MLPTIEEIKSKYPNVMTAEQHQKLVDTHNLTVSVFDPYPNCNYCVGGALQMALGETEPDNVDDLRDGIFPASDILADTLHYYCEIPYGYTDYATFSGDYPCPFPQHKDKDCFVKSGETAFTLADEITRANDRGDFDYAWSCVEAILKGNK